MERTAEEANWVSLLLTAPEENIGVNPYAMGGNSSKT